MGAGASEDGTTAGTKVKTSPPEERSDGGGEVRGAEPPVIIG